MKLFNIQYDNKNADQPGGEKGDATVLQYRKIDDGGDGVPILFIPGIGGNHLIFAPICKDLRQTHPLYFFMPPGLPHGALHCDSLCVEYLCDVIVAMMKKERLQQVVIVAWSSGVQLGLEFGNRHGTSVAGLVAVNGLSSSNFLALFPRPGHAIPSSQLTRALKLHEQLANFDKMKRLFRHSLSPVKLAKRVGIVAPEADDFLLEAIIEEFVSFDAVAVDSYLRAFTSHRAEVAPNVPLLAIGSELDKIVKPRRIKTLVKNHGSATYFQIKAGTHFSPLEFPQLMATAIADFIKRKKL